MAFTRGVHGRTRGSHSLLCGGWTLYKTVGAQVHESELLSQARVEVLDSHFRLVHFHDDIARVAER